MLHVSLGCLGITCPHVCCIPLAKPPLTILRCPRAGGHGAGRPGPPDERPRGQHPRGAAAEGAALAEAVGAAVREQPQPGGAPAPAHAARVRVAGPRERPARARRAHVHRAAGARAPVLAAPCTSARTHPLPAKLPECSSELAQTPCALPCLHGAPRDAACSAHCFGGALAACLQGGTASGTALPCAKLHRRGCADAAAATRPLPDVRGVVWTSSGQCSESRSCLSHAGRSA